MVRAILKGRKTQTRRVVRDQPDGDYVAWVAASTDRKHLGCFAFRRRSPVESLRDNPATHRRSPYGEPGDRLWVRETWAGDDMCGVLYRADHPDADIRNGDLDEGEQQLRRWRPSIFMPRWASRITLEITEVRVERLQEITAADILAEGAVERAHMDQNLGKMPVSAMDGHAYVDLMSLWRKGWNSINAKRGYPWKSNPWVWAITFKVVS
jgi:hypothetical protein